MYGIREAILRDLSDSDLNELLAELDVSPYDYHEARKEADRRSQAFPAVKASKPRFAYATNTLTGKDF
tara:strand:+ start:346 stop:549 length:204 start_codon:yes stop_codon:yes gene_type:complete